MILKIRRYIVHFFLVTAILAMFVIGPGPTKLVYRGECVQVSCGN